MRLEKIRQAKAELEAEARAAAADELRRREEAEAQRKKEGRKKSGKTPAPPKQEPDGKAQRNFTDPESRILKTKDGYIKGYNAQAAVDRRMSIGMLTLLLCRVLRLNGQPPSEDSTRYNEAEANGNQMT